MSMFDDLEATKVDVPPVLAAQVKCRCDATPNAIQNAMGEAFGNLMGYMQGHGLIPAGPPRAIYTSYGPEGTDFIVAFPIVPVPAQPEANGALSVSMLAGGKTLRFSHRGPYGELMSTYNRITKYLEAQGLLQSEADWARYMPMWEEYVNCPEETPEADLLTYIYLPLP